MKQKFLILCFSVLFLTHCAIYKIDVQQGNVVTQAMLDQLSLGMPMQKVKFILGTPLIVDVFHQDRWDYIYSMQLGGEQREQRRISLFFKDEKLASVSGDVVVGGNKSEESKPVPEVTPKDEEPIL